MTETKIKAQEVIEGTQDIIKRAQRYALRNQAADDLANLDEAYKMLNEDEKLIRGEYQIIQAIIKYLKLTQKNKQLLAVKRCVIKQIPASLGRKSLLNATNGVIDAEFKSPYPVNLKTEEDNLNKAYSVAIEEPFFVKKKHFTARLGYSRKSNYTKLKFVIRRKSGTHQHPVYVHVSIVIAGNHISELTSLV